jgi:hypothetical protein
MGLLETLKSGYDALNSGNKTPGTPHEGGLMSVIMNLVGGGKQPEVAAEAQEKNDIFKKLREGFFGELTKSLLLRQMPRLSAMTDIGLQLSGKKSAEKVPWQNEFETITALLILVPNDWKHHITDIFASSSIFQAIVKYWPGLDGIGGSNGILSAAVPLLGEGGSLRDRILNRQPPDPDAVIQVLRIIHQDVFVTGKMSFDKLKEMIGSPAAIAAIVGGAGTLAAGAKALGSGETKTGSDSGESPASIAAASSGGVVDKIKDAIGLGASVTGKKISEIISANPAGERTKMQKNLLSLLDQLKVSDTAILKKGDWEGNNDEVTVQFEYNGNTYYMIFDNDISSTDIKVNNAQGTEIAKLTDWGNFDADDSAKDIIEAIQKNPSAPKS